MPRKNSTSSSTSRRTKSSSRVSVNRTSLDTHSSTPFRLFVLVLARSRASARLGVSLGELPVLLFVSLGQRHNDRDEIHRHNRTAAFARSTRTLRLLVTRTCPSLRRRDHSSVHSFSRTRFLHVSQRRRNLSDDGAAGELRGEEVNRTGLIASEVSSSSPRLLSEKSAFREEDFFPTVTKCVAPVLSAVTNKSDLLSSDKRRPK